MAIGDKIVVGPITAIASNPALTDNSTNIASTHYVNEMLKGRKNYIINGNFDIWQRGTSQTSSSYGSDDRWLNSSGGSTKTHSQQAFTLGQTDVPNEPKYFSRTVVTSVAGAGNQCSKYQGIESVRTLAGKTATLSFYAKADAAKNIAVEFLQDFGTGGSPSAAITGIGVTTCALTTSWQKFTVTVNIPSINGKTLGTSGDDRLNVLFWFDAGSDYNSRANSLGQQSGTFDIAQVQLEEGSVATNFEVRHPATELALCQRYYEVGSGVSYFPSAGTAYSGVAVNYKVTKRAAPTVTVFDDVSTSGKVTAITGPGGQVANAYSYASTGLDTTNILHIVYAGGSSIYGLRFTFAADAEL